KQRQLLLANRAVKDEDVAESSPDGLGAPLELPAQPAEAGGQARADARTASQGSKSADTRPEPKPDAGLIEPMPVAARESVPIATAAAAMTHSAAFVASQRADPLPTRGTVVLDVEQGGIVVPSFIGKPLRAVIEAAQSSGVEVDAMGSGIAR